MRVLSRSALLAGMIMLASPVAPSFACNGNGHCSTAPGQVRGAPAPLAGAGLPVLAVGYGVYWLVKRRRRTPD
jgi:hypothetical protein